MSGLRKVRWDPDATDKYHEPEELRDDIQLLQQVGGNVPPSYNRSLVAGSSVADSPAAAAAATGPVGSPYLPAGSSSSSSLVQPWLTTTTTYTYGKDNNSDSDSNSENSTTEEEEEEDIDAAALDQLYAHNDAILTSPERMHERMEWQQMLHSVLMGEVIKSEKKRLLVTDEVRQQKPIQDIWLSLRSLLRGRTIEQETKYLEEARREMNQVVQMVLNFKVQQDARETALEQVSEVLITVDSVESLYATRAAMIRHNPEYASPEFQKRLDALNAWCTITRSLQMQHKILADWTGSDDLQIARKSADGSVFNDQSFIERLLKESALQDTFDKRTLSALYSLLVKSKQTVISNNVVFTELCLPPFIPQLRRLASFPTALVEEALKMRLEYKSRIDEAPKTTIDTMIEDYRGLLSLACRVKLQYEELANPAPGWDLKGETFINEGYDAVLLESVRFYFKLIAWKLKSEKENTLKECEVMEKEWEFLKSTVFRAVATIEWECAEQFCAFTNHLLMDVMSDFASNLETLSAVSGDDEGIEFKYTQLLHTMRMRARKLLQFSRFFLGEFENAAEYNLENEETEKFMTDLVDSGHFLVYTGSFEEERIYIIASPSLYGRGNLVSSIVRSTLLTDQNNPNTPGTPGSLPSEQYEDYVLIISPWNSVVWTGDVVQIPIPFVQLGIKPKRVRLVTGDTRRLHSVRSKFLVLTANSSLGVVHEHRANIPKVNKELYKIKMTAYKLAEFTMTSVNTIRSQTHNLSCQELVEECFSFASDFGMRTARMLEMPLRLQLDLKLVQLAIDWISFITEECIPTDRKTFRWAVAALEFGHLMTRGANILALGEDEFTTLQQKVAHCIALLISHFDVLGTRWRSHEQQLREEKQRKRGITAKRNSYMTSKRMEDKDAITVTGFGSGSDAASDAAGVTYIRDAWMRKIMELEQKRNKAEQEQKIVGKVLDDQSPEDQSLMFLAPSASNISFRWQQGRFIGSGTFGYVYLAINLDTSSVMAVKEIRVPDSSSLSALHKAIKEEMKVMEMLNHPNIVQYYGMEVHRDKVFIFMEYCENGSLGALLEHGGRIEDEFYIVHYAYQLLKGLAYLHENNIVHRDIKPDNILLDHQGHPKLSDFGAAKILAKNQKTMGRTTMNMNVNSLAGTPMYMAPEVITGGDTGRMGSMDIWSLACCIVQMATGRRPWSTLENEWSVMYHVVTGHPPLPDPSQLSSLGIDFLKKCFTRNPTKRPTAKELLSHPWITNFLESYHNETSMPYSDEHSLDATDTSRSEVSAPFNEQPIVRSVPNSLSLNGFMNNSTGHQVAPEEAQTYFASVQQQISASSQPSSHSSLSPPSINTRDFATATLNRRSSATSTGTAASLVRSVTTDQDPSRPVSPV